MKTSESQFKTNAECVGALVLAERERQVAKWGVRKNTDVADWNLILTEEVGELAEALLDYKNCDPGHIDDQIKYRNEALAEAIQVAACASAIAQYLITGEA